MRIRIFMLFALGFIAATLMFMGAGVSVSGSIDAYGRDPMEVWFGYALSSLLVFFLAGSLGQSIARSARSSNPNNKPDRSNIPV